MLLTYKGLLISSRSVVVKARLYPVKNSLFSQRKKVWLVGPARSSDAAFLREPSEPERRVFFCSSRIKSTNFTQQLAAVMEAATVCLLR